MSELRRSRFPIRRSGSIIYLITINKMKTLKISLGLLLIPLFIPGIVKAENAPGFAYTQVDSEAIDASMVKAGSVFDVLDHHLLAELTPNQITKPGVIEFMKLDITEGSSMRTPSGFIGVAPVIEYKLRNTQLKYRQEIKLTIPFESDVKFSKFAYYWSFKKQAWREVESVTDLASKTVTLTMSLANTRILIADTDAMVQGHASWYKYKGCMCAASPDYPKGSKLLVTNLNKNESIVVKINDWGPERDLFPKRVIDLDVVAFKKLGSKGAGVLTNIRVVPFHPEGFDKNTVEQLSKGNAVKIEESLITPYIPKKYTTIALQ